MSAENFARGLKVSKGDIVFFCDQDDVWNKSTIEMMVDAINNFNADLVFCNADVCNDKLTSLNVDMLSKVGFEKI